MNSSTKLMLGATMTLALLFGFFHSMWPDAPVSFKHLHIFGFNLLAGGSLILCYTEGPKAFSSRVKTYFVCAILYALCAASEMYLMTIALSVPLLYLVESVRVKRFGFIPSDFFRRVPVSDKFNHASLLCLSCGIVFATLVILNNEYLGLIDYEKLTIEVFFLGYSFPASLITMSIMFSFMTRRINRLVNILKEISFWSVNLGVILFFVFIIFELTIAQILISTLLFITVWMIFFLFIGTAPSVQQKTFLVSGMVFLLFTALTGIFYIVIHFYPSLYRYSEQLLVLHAMVSLYGWNLSGLFIIIRWSDFPIRLNSLLAISLHWGIVLVLAPLGKYFMPVSFVATVAYVILLLIVFSGRADHRRTS